MKGFAALDIETTGFSPGRDRIIEVSLVLYSVNGVEEGTYSTLVNPSMPIPPAASSVNGIEDHMVADAPSFAQIAPDLRAALDGRILVGHNIVGFDNRFLATEFEDAGMQWSAEAALDTLQLARVAYPGLKNHKLATLCELTGIVNEHAHRAESDARTAWQLLCTIAADDVDDLTDLDVYDLPVFPSGAPGEVVARKPAKVVADPSLLQTCAGEVVVFTGGRPSGFASRDEAKNEVLRRGGQVGVSVTKKTTIVFAGDNAGAKLDRARELGVVVAPHAVFPDFLARGRDALDGTASATIRRFDGRDDHVGAEPHKATISPDRNNAPVASHRPPVVVVETQSQPPAPTLPEPTVAQQLPPVVVVETQSQPPAPTLREPTVAPQPLPPPVIEQAGGSVPPAPMPSSSANQPATSGDPARQQRKSVGLAVTLALFLGVFGAHRVYLGKWRSGLVMAALSVLSFGILVPLVFVASCIDAYRIATYRFPA